MYDIIFIGEKNIYWKELKQRFPTLKTASTVADAKRICITKMFWVVWPDIIVNDDFNFDYQPDAWSTDYVHVFKNNKFYDGISLIPKDATIADRELQHRFFVNKKEIDVQTSCPRPYDVFNVDTYEDYLQALETSTTEMFWMSSPNIDVDTNVVNTFYISHHDQLDRKQNHAFIHQVDGKDLYNGVFLCSKHLPLSKKEVEYRFPVNRKEHDIVASGPCKYDVFEIDTYEDYLQAIETSTTEMFYIIPPTVTVCKDFMFDDYFEHSNTFDRQINHVFLNGEYHDGVVLCSKKLKISKREWHFKFIAGKKENNTVASMPNPYDVVFISYQEPDADTNYANLLKKVPMAKRVHGVKGIHQAHIQAAMLCNTPMFWIVDGDAKIVDDFNFDYQVPAWQYNHVHVWRSKNPVNGLVYGYGGIKLFPRQETIDMDTSKPDMTTSISDKFVAVKTVSNITGFNTGEFETWKSAFRECCKLSSKVIDRQKDVETNKRLKIWTSIGRDKPFGEYALRGAKAGMLYGTTHKGDVAALKKINDFEWLEEQFNGNL
jgi:hypothetical protein